MGAGILSLNNCGIHHGYMNDLTTSKYNPLTRTIGVELEIAGFVNPPPGTLADLYNTCVKWRTAIGTDGSIRATEGSRGVEIRTAPAAGNRFLNQLGSVMHAINRANGVVNNTCGLHVHVGLQDIKANNVSATVWKNELGKLIYMWSTVEDAFYDLVTDERSRNRYCQRAMSNFTYTEALRLYAAQGNYYHVYNATVGYLERYLGFNTQAITKYGTIEFRLHHGSLDRSIVPRWAMLCCAFVENVLKQSVDTAELYKFVTAVGGREYLKAIAPTDAVRDYVERTYRERDAREGIRRYPLRSMAILQRKQKAWLKQAAQTRIMRAA